MSFESTAEGIIDNKNPVVKWHKLDMAALADQPNDFVISSREDFDVATKIAHAYSKDYIDTQPTLETFNKIGSQIGTEFQFTDQVGGCDTLAGQLHNNSIENRDCKLPTFLLALAWKELDPDSNPDIIFLKSNIAHPYVRIRVGEKTLFGHYTKPNPSDPQPSSWFEILSDERTEELENFITRDRAYSFSPDTQGMKAIDDLFMTV